MIMVVRVRWNREKKSYDRKTKVTTIEKSWPEETLLIAVEKQEHVQLALQERCEEGQTPHIRQIDVMNHGVELFLHVDDVDPAGEGKEDKKD